MVSKTMVTSLLTAILALGSNTYSAEASELFNLTSDCSCDSADPYDPKNRMPVGPFKGDCLNTCMQRSAQLLDSESEDILRVANFGHAGQFWIAEIPANGVAEVIFQIQYFNVLPSPHSAHGQLRFRMKPDQAVNLTPQIPGSWPKESVTLADFIYSANAIGVRHGIPWDPFGGMVGFYAIAHQFTSLDDSIDIIHGFPFTDRVEQYILTLTDTQKQQLLRTALQRSTQLGISQEYNTVNRNCTTEALAAIDRVTGYSGDPQVISSISLDAMVVNLVENLNIDQTQLNRLATEVTPIVNQVISSMDSELNIVAPIDALQARNIIDESSRLPNLEQAVQKGSQ